MENDPNAPAPDAGPARDPETGQFTSNAPSDAPADAAAESDAADPAEGDESAADDESGAAEEDEAPRPWTSPELSGEVEPPKFEQQGPPPDLSDSLE